MKREALFAFLFYSYIFNNAGVQVAYRTEYLTTPAQDYVASFAINTIAPMMCRTDLGGPNAPNDPASAIPGVIVGAFVDDGRSGRYFPAGAFYDMTLEEAVTKAETM